MADLKYQLQAAFVKRAKLKVELTALDLEIALLVRDYSFQEGLQRPLRFKEALAEVFGHDVKGLT